MSSIKSSKLIKVWLVLAILVCSFYAFYFQGFPFEEEACATAWRHGTLIPWQDLIGDFFSPRFNHFVGGEAPEGLSAVETTRSIHNARLTETLILKALHEFFGPSILAVKIYNLAIVAIQCLLLLLLIYWATQSLAAGFLGVLFLMATPAYGWTVVELGEWAPADQVFLLIYLVLFLYKFQSILRHSSEKIKIKDILFFILLWFSGIVAIRAKDTGKFLVMTLSYTLLFLNPGGNLFRSTASQKKYGFFPLLFVTILLTIPVFWVRERSSLSVFNPQQLLDPFYAFFMNPQGWTAETTSSLFSFKRHLPVSILSNLGFFLSWSVIAAAAALIFQKKKKNETKESGISFILLFGIWSLAGLGFYAFYKALLYTRHQVWVLPPFTLLCAVILVRALRLLSPEKKKIFGTLLILIVSFKILDNTYHSLYLRQQLEELWRPKWAFRAEVCKAETGKDCDLFEIDQYWQPRTDFTRRLQELWVGDSPASRLQDPDFQSILKDHGHAYIVLSEQVSNPQAQLLKELDSCSYSLLTTLKMKVSGNPCKKHSIYRVSS